ncbi:hypothetical protein B0H14DRAFT_3869132, partial [Mycena olivaceomarginata]
GIYLIEGDLICTYSSGALCAYSVAGHHGVGELDPWETEDSDDVCPTNLNGSTSSSSQPSSSSQDQGTTPTRPPDGPAKPPGRPTSTSSPSSSSPSAPTSPASSATSGSSSRITGSPSTQNSATNTTI